MSTTFSTLKTRLKELIGDETGRYAKYYNDAINGAARELMTDFMWTRSMAVKQNNNFKIFFINNHQYKILDDDNNNGNIDTGEWTDTKDIQEKYGDVMFDSLPAQDPVFQTRGTITPCTVTIKNDEGWKNIMVNMAGRIKIE